MNEETSTPQQKTDWGSIFKDILILMCVMGTLGYVCNLLMKPFETITPVDSLISLIRKGNVSMADEPGTGPVVKDAPYLKELKKVLGNDDAQKDHKQENQINTQDNTGRTPLMWAVYANYNDPPLENSLKEQVDSFKELLQNTYDEKNPKKKEAMVSQLRSDFEPLMTAFNQGSNYWDKTDILRLYYLRTLLESPGIDVNIKDKDGFTALHWAAWSGMPYCAYALVQAGLDINARENNGYTPLMLAAMRGNADTVNMLLKLGADKNIANARGETALILVSSAAATYHKSDKFVYTLIYSNKRDEMYRTAEIYLSEDVQPASKEEIEGQLAAVWNIFENQLRKKSDKNSKIIAEAEQEVEKAAGAPPQSSPDQAPQQQQ